MWHQDALPQYWMGTTAQWGTVTAGGSGLVSVLQSFSVT